MLLPGGPSACVSRVEYCAAICACVGSQRLLIALTYLDNLRAGERFIVSAIGVQQRMALRTGRPFGNSLFGGLQSHPTRRYQKSCLRKCCREQRLLLLPAMLNSSAPPAGLSGWRRNDSGTLRRRSGSC
jgi:hypothetical protein